MREPLRASFIVLTALVASPRAFADDVEAPRAWQGSGRVELGAEHDTNPARVELVDGQPSDVVAPASPAVRAVASGDLAARLGDRLTFVAFAAAAARVFTRDAARDESVGIVQGSGQLAVALSRPLTLSLSTTYYDAFQKRMPTARDFRSVAPALRLDAAVGSWRVFGGGGYRWFTYKPEPAYDFKAPTALLGMRVALARAGDDDVDRPDWDLALHASWEGRSFNDERCVLDDEARTTGVIRCKDGSTSRREDHFLAATTELTRTGAFLLGLGLSGHIDASNSYGQTLQRLIVFIRGSVLLPAQLTLAGRADVVLTRYSDRLPLGSSGVANQPLVSLEDESRSTFRLELTRPLGESFEVAARWTFFTSAPATGAVSYDRHVFMTTIAWLFGSL